MINIVRSLHGREFEAVDYLHFTPRLGAQKSAED